MAERCTDELCQTCEADPQMEQVCNCGDWRSNHAPGDGPCRLCNPSRRPWEHCDEFVFLAWERHGPITRLPAR